MGRKTRKGERRSMEDVWDLMKDENVMGRRFVIWQNDGKIGERKGRECVGR